MVWFSGTVNEQNAAVLQLSRITFRFQFVKVVITITAATQPSEEVCSSGQGVECNHLLQEFAT